MSEIIELPAHCLACGKDFIIKTVDTCENIPDDEDLQRETCGPCFERALSRLIN